MEEIRPGDRVFFEPEELHWHGAAPDRFMVHLTLLDVDDAGKSTETRNTTGKRVHSVCGC